MLALSRGVGCDGRHPTGQDGERLWPRPGVGKRMSKPITVQSCAYVHPDDIDPETHASANDIEVTKDKAVSRAIAALENDVAGWSHFHRANVQTLFEAMTATHRTIRKVLEFGWQDPRSIDAMVLARVPLEHLYTLCLMFEDSNWIDVYLKDGWKKQYERFLLQREETKNLPRYDDYSKKSGPRNLETQRQFLGITDAQKAATEHVQLGTPMPEGLAREKITRFPSPSGVIDKIDEGAKRRMLERLYPEYVFFCSFVHGLPDALLFRVMFDKDSRVPKQHDDETIKDTFRRQVELPAYSTSLISIVQAVSELSTLYPADVDLKAAVTEAWEKIVEGMLLGRAIWAIRTKALLGVVG